jgi:hypothetical protein
VAPVDWSLLTVGSVLFDAVFVPGGALSTEALGADGAAVLFVREAYKHCKAVGGGGSGLAMLRAASLDDAIGTVPAFLKAIAQHRGWAREEQAQPRYKQGNGRPGPSSRGAGRLSARRLGLQLHGPAEGVVVVRVDGLVLRDHVLHAFVHLGRVFLLPAYAGIHRGCPFH